MCGCYVFLSMFVDIFFIRLIRLFSCLFYLLVLFCMCAVFLFFVVFFFFKQKTAYELRISDWSSDVCSSDLSAVFGFVRLVAVEARGQRAEFAARARQLPACNRDHVVAGIVLPDARGDGVARGLGCAVGAPAQRLQSRSEESRGGKGGGSTGRSRVSPAHSKKQTQQ